MTLVLAIVGLFGSGLVSTLSPCVAPLVPGYLGIVGSGGGVDGDRRWLRVAAFAASALATFVALGGLVAAVGWRVASTSLWLQRAAGVGAAVYGVALLAGREGRAGGHVRLIRRLPRQPYVAAVALGVGCGAAWSPCVGPLLAAALAAAGATTSVVRGSLFLAVFGAGVLTPFVALAAMRTARIPARLRRVGAMISGASGVLLVVLGVALTFGWYESLVQRLAIGT